MASRLTSNRFVGRYRELEELEQAAAEAAERRPTVVLLGGESGVGKTRLVCELEHRLGETGALVLRGEGVDQGDEELPYAPLTAALRPLVRSGHEALGQLTAASRSDLAVLLPGLDESAPRVPRAEQSQLALFEALFELIDMLSESRLLVLMLEDMHWADRSTRTFVSFLARGMRQERVMTLLTYRSDELHRRHPLRPLLSELERLDHVHRIALEPFGPQELAEILGDILGRAPDTMLVERLFARSEGNPLYTEELLAAGLDGRGSAPQSLSDAFLLRVERLSTEAQQAARALAAGRRLDEPALAELTGLEPLALQAALREAISEQVLVAADDGRLRFRHALLREAVYDDLLPGERAELHLKLAELLEARVVDGGDDAGSAAEIAFHYNAAGDQPAALRAYVQAALAARDVMAYADAAGLAERALELWGRVPDGERGTELDHVDVLRLAASAHSIAGDFARSEVLVRRALGELDEESDRLRYTSTLAYLARLQWSLNRGLEGIETAQRALAMLPLEPSSERAGVMAWLARTRFLRGRFREAIAEGEAALAVAREVCDIDVEGRILNTLGMARIAFGEVEQGQAQLRRAIEIAVGAGDVNEAGYAYANLADMLSLAGRPQEALAVALEGLAVVPARMTRGHDHMLLTVSMLAFEAGDWAQARAYLTPQPAQVHGILLIFRLLREAEMALGEGDEDSASSSLEEAGGLVAASSEPQWIGAFGALLGELRRRLGELTAARAAVEDGLDRLELCTDDVMRIARLSSVGARVEADIAQRARDLREPGDERDAIKRARLHVERLAAAAHEGGPVERAWHASGKADLARARGRNRAGPWEAAAGLWREIGRPYEQAIMRWRAAEAYAETERRDAAAVALTEVLETARRLGSSWLEHEAAGLAGRARIDVRPDGGQAAANGDSREAEPEDPFGLTPRERQVLALIAQGATNRQIGAALFMAEKTASVHVSRILAKMGVQSRTQAAALAHRLALG